MKLWIKSEIIIWSKTNKYHRVQLCDLRSEQRLCFGDSVCARASVATCEECKRSQTVRWLLFYWLCVCVLVLFAHIFMYHLFVSLPHSLVDYLFVVIVCAVRADVRPNSLAHTTLSHMPRIHFGWMPINASKKEPNKWETCSFVLAKWHTHDAIPPLHASVKSSSSRILMFCVFISLEHFLLLKSYVMKFIYFFRLVFVRFVSCLGSNCQIEVWLYFVINNIVNNDRCAITFINHFWIFFLSSAISCRADAQIGSGKYHALFSISPKAIIDLTAYGKYRVRRNTIKLMIFFHKSVECMVRAPILLTSTVDRFRWFH